MSAFIVDKSHIDALVAVALHGPKDSSHQWEGPRWAAFDPDETSRQEQEWREVGYSTNHTIANVTPDQAGDMLTIENVRSITFRYPDTLDGGPLPGPTVAYWDEPFQFALPSRPPTVVEALKLIDCFEYQACEHDEWSKSEAFRFCEALRRSLVGTLPGYDAAPWEWSA